MGPDKQIGNKQYGTSPARLYRRVKLHQEICEACNKTAWEHATSNYFWQWAVMAKTSYTRTDDRMTHQILEQEEGTGWAV